MSEERTITVRRRTVFAAVAALAASAAAIGGTASWAATRAFSDVPPSHPFYEEISWAEWYGIVNGYPDGTFRPGNTVTRQAAVAFIANYNDSLRFLSSSTNPPSGNSFQHSTNCSTSERAIAGGGTINQVNILMTDSQPVSAGDGWYVRWESDDNTTSDPASATVWVLCAPLVIP